MSRSKEELDALIARRDEIDRALAEHHTQELAILFSDIVGSTEVFEQRGDIEGLAMVHRHNTLLFPVVAAHRGRIVKTIGDAIMAIFEEPADGVRCGVAMQQALAGARSRGENIHIRVGVHAGRVVLDDGDVFGDAVNTASRIAGKAGGDEVLCSSALFERVPREDGLAAGSRGAVPLKGKAEPVPVVVVAWEGAAALRVPPDGIFVLDLQMGPKGLRVAFLDGAGDKGPVRTFAETGLSLEELEAAAGPLEAFLQGESRSYAPALREVGARLWDKALSEAARRHLRETPRRHLRLHLDDVIAQVPWELMHDGQGHLGVRFAVGRVISTSGEARVAGWNPGQGGGRALVVSNPSGDLPDAAGEGEAVAALLQEGWQGEVVHLRGPVDRAAFLAALPGTRLLHFAGHAVPARGGEPGGLRLSDGIAGPEEMASAAVGRPPDLVFANGCHASSARGWTEEARGTSGLAAGLLLRGVRHYLGPVGSIPDQDALVFALRFYESVLSGATYGEAARGARLALLDEGRQALSFARYVLYGEPRTAFPPGQVRRIAPRTRAAAEVFAPPPEAKAAVSAPAAPPEAKAEVLAPAPEAKAPAGPRIVALGAVLVAGAGLAALLLARPDAPAPPAEAVVQAEAPAQAEALAQAEAPVPVSHEGPLRLAILELKHVGGDADPHLGTRVQDALTTELGGLPEVRLTERASLDYDLKELELEQSHLFDPATRARMGRLMGAEVVVVGGYQQAGDQLRVSARFVDVETGRVLHAIQVQRPASELFELQDALAEAARASLGPLTKALRP